MHVWIKTVSKSTEEKRPSVSSRDIQFLRGRIRQLKNELQLTKNLIESLVAQQQIEDHMVIPCKTTHEQIRIIREKTEVIGGVTYNMVPSDEK